MSDNFILKVNSQNYTNWDNLNIYRSVDEFSGSFNFETSDNDPNSAGYPIRANDAVQVLINNTPMITGFVDEIESNFEKHSHTISVRGRDNLRNLIDTDIPQNWKQDDNVGRIANFEELCRLVIAATGNNDIPIVNTVENIPDFSEQDTEESQAGQKALEFLSSFARKRNLYLNSDGNGALRIYRPENIRASDDLLLLLGNDPRNNIKSRNIIYNTVDRVRTVTVRSQQNFSLGFFSFLDRDTEGTATDTEISTGRHLEIISEEGMTNAECEARAREEINVIRARSTQYSCVISGAVQSNGVPWNYGFVVLLVDEVSRVFGDFFIREVSITQSKNEGTNTVLTLAPSDAYRVIADIPQQERRLKELGKTYLRS